MMEGKPQSNGEEKEGGVGIHGLEKRERERKLESAGIRMSEGGFETRSQYIAESDEVWRVK